MGSAKEPSHLILHRILLLFIGLAAVAFFRSWGLLGYIAFVIIYCRILANIHGVEVPAVPFESPTGNLYATLLISSFCLALIGAVVGYNFFDDELKTLALSWDSKSIIGFEPKCFSRTPVFKNSFFNCNSLYWWISLLSLLVPLVFAIALVDMVKFSQLRVRLGKWIFVVFVFAIILLTIPFLFSITLSGINHFGFMRIISLYHLSLFVPLLLNRFSF